MAKENAAPARPDQKQTLENFINDFKRSLEEWDKALRDLAVRAVLELWRKAAKERESADDFKLNKHPAFQALLGEIVEAYATGGPTFFSTRDDGLVRIAALAGRRGHGLGLFPTSRAPGPAGARGGRP